MFKITLCAVAVMAAATTGAYAECATAKNDLVKKFENTAHVLMVAKNSLENYEDALASKDIKCAASYREAYTAAYLPELVKLKSETLEPIVKLKAAPLADAYRAALQDGVDLNEADKRIEAFYKAVGDYKGAAYKNEWTYDTKKDEMRGTITHFWGVNSTDTAALEWPYKAARARVLVYQTEENGVISSPEAMVYVDDGQLTYDRRDDYLSAKFDDKPVDTYGGGKCGDDGRNYCFNNWLTTAVFLMDLTNSRKAIIEMPFYKNGTHQFHFDISGLNTLRPTPKFKKKAAK
jgi:hypothetical protein